MEPEIFYILVALISLILGSFFSVVIHRSPKGESIVTPRSHCPACQHPLGLADLIPILSWLVARGHCRHCGAAIPVRYLLLELLVPALLLYAAWQDGPSWLFVRDAIFLSLLVILSFIDLDTMELPHRFTLPGIASGLLFAVLGVSQRNEIYWSHAVLGAALGYLLPWLLSLLYSLVRGRAGIGGGDFVLLAMIGAHTGPMGILVSFLAAVLLGSIFGIALMLRAKPGARGQLAIPFGPFLAAGGVIALFWGTPILDAYKSWMLH